MKPLRVALAVFLAGLGSYYAFKALWTLFYLRQTTLRWVELSGDPDFRLDTPMFQVWIGTGAAAVLLLGWATIVAAAKTAAGRPWVSRRWGWLALLAPVIHIPWLLYRMIGVGTLPRIEAAASTRATALRFTAICLAFLVMWLIARLDPRLHRGRQTERA